MLSLSLILAAALSATPWELAMTPPVVRAPRPAPVEPDRQDNGPFHLPAPVPPPTGRAVPVAVTPAATAPPPVPAWYAVPDHPGYQYCDHNGIRWWYPAVPSVPAPVATYAAPLNFRRFGSGSGAAGSCTSGRCR